MKYTVEEVREWAAFAQAQGKLYAPMKGAHEPWEKLEAMLTAYADLLERIKASEGANDRIDFKGMWNAMSDSAYAHPPAQAAQSVDIEAIREVIESHIKEAKKLRHDPESQDYLYEQADKLEAAIKGVA